jgi:hypothetical protein
MRKTYFEQISAEEVLRKIQADNEVKYGRKAASKSAPGEIGLAILRRPELRSAQTAQGNGRAD